jgi:hypothetical protein
MWTEHAIRHALDGTFTRYKYTDRGTIAVTAVVARDFIPDYDAPPDQKQGRANAGRRLPWSAEDDATIIELRSRRVPVKAVAKAIGRCAKAVGRRWHALMRAGVVA